MITVCALCNKEREREKKLVNYYKKNNWQFFCSKTCQYKSRLTGNHIKCGVCSKDIYRRIKQKSKSGKYFCSRSCATVFNNSLKVGSKHPNFKDGLTEAYRKKAFSFYKTKCELCSYSIKEVLQVHHIDKNRSNNKVENLVILCPTHHREIHLGISRLNRERGVTVA